MHHGVGVYVSSRGGVKRSTWPSTKTQLRLFGVAGKEAKVLEAPTLLPAERACTAFLSDRSDSEGIFGLGGLTVLKFVCLTESV